MELVASINKAQKLWKAEVYPQFDGLTEKDFINMAGGLGSRILRYFWQNKHLSSLITLSYSWIGSEGNWEMSLISTCKQYLIKTLFCSKLPSNAFSIRLLWYHNLTSRTETGMFLIMVVVAETTSCLIHVRN